MMDSYARRLVGAMLLGFLLSFSSTRAQDGPGGEDYGPQPKQAAKVKKIDAENLKKYKGNKDILVLPGLVANKKEKTVKVIVESTGLGENESAEYMVVSRDSSHGYESLLWAHAKPSDIHKALLFIGLREGASADPSRLRFWAKGERVNAFLGDKDGDDAVRLEELIYDKTTEKTLPEKGFIFTGSLRFPDPKNKGQKLYVADRYDPKSIIPSYNEPTSVMDVPWQASKGQFYESHVINSDYVAEAHELQMLILEPTLKNGEKRIRDLVLSIPDRQTFVLTDKETKKKLVPEPNIKAALEFCLQLIKKGKDPYVTLKFGDKLKLAEIQGLSAGMAMLDQPRALRIDPPEKGRLYYRSFLSTPRWRKPENRMSQAWELHISRTDKGLTGRMDFYKAFWPEGSMKPEFKKITHPAPTPKSVRDRLDTDQAAREKANERLLPGVLMVFAPADLEYGELLRFLAPAMKTHETVHLFLEAPVQE